MSLKIEVDWYHTGFATESSAPDFVGTGVDVSNPDLVRVDSAAGGGISLEYGRDQSTALAPTVAGRGGFALDNKDRRFSPRNASSPLFGFIKPARPVRITRTLPTLGTYGLFNGRTDDSPINPDPESKSVRLSLVDDLAYFRGVKITTSLYSGIRTGEAIGYILDACGWPLSLRTLDPGATVIPWWWEDNEDALTALDKVLRSEGPPAMLTMGTSGEIIFLDRHHRLTRSASITPQATWNVDGGAEPVMNVPFSYDEAWRNIVNDGLMEIPVRAPRPVEPVWTSDIRISLVAGEQREITASTNDPFREAVVPQLDTDYQLLSGSVTVTLTRTSGASTTIQLTAGGSGAVVDQLQLRAQPVTVNHSVQVSVTDVQSVADYGQRSFPSDLPWCNPEDAEAILGAAVAHRAQPLPILSVSFLISSGLPESRAAAILTRDLSDRITIIEPETQLNHQFFIESITHDLSGEFDHTVTFGLEMVPGQTTAPAFRFDTAGAGFNDGHLGTGVDDPATVFQFNSNVAGHRFDEGAFAS